MWTGYRSRTDRYGRVISFGLNFLIVAACIVTVADFGTRYTSARSVYVPTQQTRVFETYP